MIESVCNRARYITNDNGRKGPVETLRDLGAPDLADDVEEVFVLRDAIAHNHLWEAQIEDHETKGLTLIAAKLRAGYGDTKFNRILDAHTRTTKRLGLDLFPNRIHRGTATLVIRKVAEVFRFLRSKDPSLLGGADPQVMWQRKPTPFCVWADHVTGSSAPRTHRS